MQLRVNGMPWNEKIEFDSHDWEQIEEMCLIQCTGKEIANVMRVSYDTLERRIFEEYEVSVADYIEKIAAPGKMSLRRSQYKNAVENNNTAMQIWLGKQWLNQRDKEEIDQNTTIRIVDDTSKDGIEDPAVTISD